MPKIYDRNDLAWTYRGGFILGQDGDLADTKADPLRSVFQEIRDEIRSDINSWKLYPKKGASLSDFVGEPNDQRTAEAIKTRIIACLTRYGLVDSADLKVKYVPVDVNNLMIRISIAVAPTAANKGTSNFSIHLGYNYSENNVYMID
jgi:hypothetical protein